MLRATPNVHTWRPCDATETVAAWQGAIEHRDGPTCLILSRQNLPHQTRNSAMLADIRRGGYILHACDGVPEVILMATGSEVQLCMDAAKQLTAQGVRVQVVSLPCWEVFLAQDEAYQEKVLPKAVSARIAVEAGAPLGWYRFVGLKGRVLGIDRFGESAPAPALFTYFGLTSDHVIKAVNSMMNKQSSLSTV